jgi:hypothetical protein
MPVRKWGNPTFREQERREELNHIYLSSDSLLNLLDTGGAAERKIPSESPPYARPVLCVDKEFWVLSDTTTKQCNLEA